MEPSLMPTDNFEFAKKTCRLLAYQHYQTLVTRCPIGWLISTNASYLRTMQAGQVTQEIFKIKQYKKGEYYYEDYIK